MKYDATSIIGLSKNAGKTTLLNALIEKNTRLNKRLGLASIGVDGEQRDVWSGQQKPSIYAPANSLVITTKDGLKEGHGDWRILEKLDISSTVGELFIAESLTGGSVKLLGIPAIDNLYTAFRALSKYKPDKILLDGAYDRFSNANPVLTNQTFVVVGASLHANEEKFWLLVRKKLYNLFLPALVNPEILAQVKKESGQQILIGYKNGSKVEITPKSYFSDYRIFHGDIEWLITPSILTDTLLQEMLKNKKGYHIVIMDGLKNFASEHLIARWLEKGGTIQVVYPIHVKGIAINPYSPEGHFYASSVMKEGIKRILQQFQVAHIPVFDIYLDDIEIDE